MTTSQFSVCVFGGARAGASSAALAAAAEVGRLLGEAGHRLVYGAGGTGIMGAVSWAAAQAGAPITGVIPSFLRELEREEDAPAQEVIVTEGLLERKQRMFELADAFLALPGGYGTLDEIVEVISTGCLRQHAKPLVLLNTGGIWSGLVELAEQLHHHDYAHPEPARLFSLAATPQEAMELLTASPATAPSAAPSAVPSAVAGTGI
ncbi:TIGR00730 family Rossman fold protein [Spirillospora sp. NPDC050679]